MDSLFYSKIMPAYLAPAYTLEGEREQLLTTDKSQNPPFEAYLKQQNWEERENKASQGAKSIRFLEEERQFATGTVKKPNAYQKLEEREQTANKTGTLAQ